MNQKLLKIKELKERYQNLKWINCKHCDESEFETYGYPQYGVAPHNCYWKLGKNIGQSEILPLEKWLKYAFIPDIEGMENDDDLLKYGCRGMYYCPKCFNGAEQVLKELYNILLM